MRYTILFLLLLTFLTSVRLDAQVDEVSEITGLPIPIGASVIYGQVLIRNIPRGERRPSVYVYLRQGGAQIDKFQATDKGYWYFLKNPGNGMTLHFEVDGNELGQAMVTGGISNRFRQDVEFDWNAIKGAAQASAGVINVRDRYRRDATADEEYEQALVLAKTEPAEALVRFQAIVQRDDKDHNAWMQIGALLYGSKRLDEARVAFSRSATLKPDYFLAHLNLGKLELSEKKFDAAVASLSKAVEVEPRSADANHLLGEAHLQNKKGSLAVGFLNKAIELDPLGKAELHLRLAALYNGAGLRDRAALEYKLFLGKVKDHPDRKRLEQYVKDNLPKT